MAERNVPTRVTLATVARRAGVSVTTVSVVLAGRPELLARYHPDTVAKVQQAARKLQYRANLFATSLPAQKSPFFALVLPDFRREALGESHVHGYESSLLAGVIWAGTERRLYPVTLTMPRDPDASAVEEVGRVIDGGVFGTIARSPNLAFERFLCPRFKAGHPMVAIFPRRMADWPTNGIDVDNEQVGRTAARLLVSRRRSRWVLVRYQKMVDSDRARCEAFLAEAGRAGAEPRPIRVPMGLNEHEVCDFLTERLRRLRPEAIFAPESTSSVGAMLACARLGLVPERDFDLVGCDSASWRVAGLPSITCVDVSWEQAGTRAVEELSRMYETGARQFRTVLLAPRVVPGGTCPVAPESSEA
jgi:LacI family transcriptional regulator